MIQVWKRKREPTPGLTKRTSLTGNACFPAEYIFLAFERVFVFLTISLKRCFLTSVKPLVVKD